MHSEAYWHSMAMLADRSAVSEDMGRASQPMGKGWRDYHKGEATIEVIGFDGQRHYITPKQYQVYRAVQLLKERATLTMIAASIGVATSTVSRALLRLASFGLVAYDTQRGRYGGVTMLALASVDLKRRAQAAWEVLKGYRMRAEARWYERLARSGYSILRPIGVVNAKLNWTPDDMASVDLEYGL